MYYTYACFELLLLIILMSILEELCNEMLGFEIVGRFKYGCILFQLFLGEHSGPLLNVCYC